MNVSNHALMRHLTSDSLPISSLIKNSLNELLYYCTINYSRSSFVHQSWNKKQQGKKTDGKKACADSFPKSVFDKRHGREGEEISPKIKGIVIKQNGWCCCFPRPSRAWGVESERIRRNFFMCNNILKKPKTMRDLLHEARRKAKGKIETWGCVQRNKLSMGKFFHSERCKNKETLIRWVHLSFLLLFS